MSEAGSHHRFHRPGRPSHYKGTWLVLHDQPPRSVRVLADVPGCAKDRLDIVGIAADNIKERGFAGGLEVSHTCLNQMACTVEFMSVPKIRPALAWLDNSIVRIEIAIWLLGRSS